MTRAAKLPAKCTLDLILARAAELRAAGITSLTLDGVAVTLAPAEPTMPTAPDDAPPPPPETPENPMQDAATYGGGRVPGFQKPKKDDAR